MVFLAMFKKVRDLAIDLGIDLGKDVHVTAAPTTMNHELETAMATRDCIATREKDRQSNGFG